MIERALGAVGAQEGWRVDAALIPRADGSGEVPWTLPLTRAQDLDFLIEKARTACWRSRRSLGRVRASSWSCPSTVRSPPSWPVRADCAIIAMAWAGSVPTARPVATGLTGLLWLLDWPSSERPGTTPEPGLATAELASPGPALR